MTDWGIDIGLNRAATPARAYGPRGFAAQAPMPAAWSSSLPPTSPTPGATPVRDRWMAGVIAHPPGQGEVAVQAGAPVASNAGLVPGDGFTGRIASQTLAALKRAGGLSAAYLSGANGNREVVVHAPKGFDPRKPYDVVVYARGIEGDNAKSLEGQFLATTLRELNANGRNVLLVLPKSPSVMKTWFAGPEDLGRLLPEALTTFGLLTGTELPPPRERWLMAHSGGGKAIQNAMEKPGSPRYDRIMLADSTYGTWAEGTLAALRRQHPGVQLATVVTTHNKKRAEAQLAPHGLRVDEMPGDDHNGVPRFMFQAFTGPRPWLDFSTVRP